ncbi:nitroreductase [Roseomonas gilardii]|uniref:Putative NAD(P)H nitroreductase n=1 Tax=Roseomonas gilardii TaxID=257708 RepID=A0ABU3MIT5_9PROT|nr:nitroreductase [Roseomonas gilardii]MDT8332230.1 nitroreductase [Roseomonas gilardii]
MNDLGPLSSGTASPVLEALLTRHSVPAQMLRAPGPEGERLHRILETALCAPDHGGLHPWRFVLIRGEARTRWAAAVEEAMRARDPSVTQPMIDKQCGRILNAPLTIAVAAHIREGKIPEVEQILTVGAGVMNLLNAFHAEGFGAIWLTGANGYDPALALRLGLGENERLLGYVFVGTPDGEARQPRRPDLSAHVTDWAG